MPNKLLIAVNAVVVVVGVILAVQMSNVLKSVSTLTQRVTDLEVQNVQLSKQFEWMEQQKALADGSSSSNRKYASRSGYPSRQGTTKGHLARSSQTASDAHLNGDAWDSSSGQRHIAGQYEGSLDGSNDPYLHQEGAVNPEEWETHQEVWENGMRDSMAAELDNFADENLLDDDVKSNISDLLAESVDRRRELRNKMASNSLSIREYMELNRKLGAEISTRSSKYLTDEQHEKFINKFHMGSKTVKRQPERAQAPTPARSENEK